MVLHRTLGGSMQTIQAQERRLSILSQPKQSPRRRPPSAPRRFPLPYAYQPRRINGRGARREPQDDAKFTNPLTLGAGADSTRTDVVGTCTKEAATSAQMRTINTVGADPHLIAPAGKRHACPTRVADQLVNPSIPVWGRAQVNGQT